MQRHEIVREIIIRPNFRPATALLNCDKKLLRWPGPFSSGFLSPQPPGAVGIGPVRRGVNPEPGPTKVGPFSFLGSAFDAAARRPRLNGRQPSPTAPISRTKNTREVSAAAYRPRRASDPASRDCRPGHRRPQHRRRRARYSRSARSSFRNCRSSRRPSGYCAPHCSR